MIKDRNAFGLALTDTNDLTFVTTLFGRNVIGSMLTAPHLKEANSSERFSKHSIEQYKMIAYEYDSINHQNGY